MAFSIPEIETAIRASRGLLTRVATYLSEHSEDGSRITRQGVQKRIRNSPRLQRILAEVSEEMKDVAEASLFKQIVEGSESNTRWYLATKARDRGYGQQVGVTAGFDEQGRPVPLSAGPSVLIYIPDNGRDPGLVDVTPRKSNGSFPARTTNGSTTISSNGADSGG